MDSSEATKTVFSRIQSLEPENASKIMGFIYIHDPGEKEMIRLAFGSEALLLSLINQAKIHLGLFSNTSCTSSAPSMWNTNRPNPLSPSLPRIIMPNNGFHVHPSSTSSTWSVSGFTSPRPASSSLSYAAVVNGSTSNGVSVAFSPPITSSLSLPPLYRTNNDPNDGSLLDDSMLKNVDFGVPIMSPSGRSDSMLLPYGNTPHQTLHRRSYSVNDEFLSGGSGSNCGFEDGRTGFGWRPCMYFARGFCKNGDSCKFLHSGFVDCHDASTPIGGSPSKLDVFDEFLRMKMIQQQRFTAASQLMAGAPFSPRSAATPLMIGEDFHKFASCWPERNANSSSKQIYLTFPADSTFKEEDVSSYFSNFGPVQDVRIPYQQKRMFGFVTFVFPETVKMILAKGNPHFICDSRVLVKPYKEKGKIPDRKQQQYQLGIGGFPSCLSPPGLESGEQSYDPFGSTIFYNTKEMALRKKMEEQAELQKAIDLQGRRLMHLQLMDLKNQNCLGHQLQPHMASSPPHPHLCINPNLILQSDDVVQEVSEVVVSSSMVATDQQHEGKEACDNSNVHEANDSNVLDDDNFHESLEHILPDNLFASPTKSACDHISIFSTGLPEVDSNSSVTTTASSSNTIPILPSTSALTMASLKSCYFQMPSH